MKSEGSFNTHDLIPKDIVEMEDFGSHAIDIGLLVDQGLALQKLKPLELGWVGEKKPTIGKTGFASGLERDCGVGVDCDDAAPEYLEAPVKGSW